MNTSEQLGDLRAAIRVDARIVSRAESAIVVFEMLPAFTVPSAIPASRSRVRQVCRS